MKLSKAVTTLTSRLVVAMGVLLPCVLNAQGLENVRFSLGSSHAAWGENNVPVNLSISGVPEGYGIEGFGFAVSYNASRLMFQGADVLTSVSFKKYLLDHDVEKGLVRIEVFFAKPVTNGNDLLALSFMPVESDLVPTDVVREFLPIRLTSGQDTWITAKDQPPLYPVGSLRSGGIYLYLKNCVEFARLRAEQATVVEMPVYLTHVTPLRILNVGIDYDEDMLEPLRLRAAEDTDDVLTGLSWERTAEGKLTIQAGFTLRATMAPGTKRPVAVMSFFVSPSAPAGRRLILALDAAESTFDGSRPLQAIGAGMITVDAAAALFRRGDVNLDGRINASDAVSILSYLFAGGLKLSCPDAADVTDNGTVGVEDVTALLSYVFTGEPVPLPPFAEVGLDPTPDTLPACTPDK